MSIVMVKCRKQAKHGLDYVDNLGQRTQKDETVF
jgi:hypothetical protein